MTDSRLIVFIVVAAIAVVGLGLFLARYGNNRIYEIELTIDQVKDYFFKRHNCKYCDTRLKRVSHDQFLGEGWSNFMGRYSYMKEFKKTFSLECPQCQKSYTSDDY